MMDVQIIGQKAHSASMTEYATDLARSGVQVLSGGPGMLACMLGNTSTLEAATRKLIG